MERYLQETKGSQGSQGGMGFMRDPTFASSTIQKRPAQPQETTKTRDPRVKTSASKYRDDWEDNGNGSSDDELLLSQQTPAKPKIGKKRVASDSQKARDTASVTQKAKKAKETAKPRPNKAKKSGKTVSSDDEIGRAPTLEELVESEPEQDSKQRKSPSRQAKKETKLNGKSIRGKNKDIEELTDSDEDKPPSTVPLKPRPFPMDLSPIRKPLHSVTASRTSNSSSPSGSRTVTASKRSVTYTSALPTSSASEDSDDPMMSYTQAVKVDQVDPDLLCPFCDEMLPQPLSATLAATLKLLRRDAVSSTSLGKQKGTNDKYGYLRLILQSPRRRVQRVAKGARSTVGHDASMPKKLARRARALKDKLRDLIEDPDLGTFFKPLQTSANQYGKNSITGAKGSWVTFENATAGYYGEQGFAIITQVLFDLFPDIDAKKIYPLEMSNYLALVLVPETALLLIQEDLKAKSTDPDVIIPRSEALTVLRDSTKYGLAMFPIDGDGDNAGDALARERALKIRKQREKEERRQSGGGRNFDTSADIVELSSSEEERTPVKKDRSSPSQHKRTLVSASQEDNASKRRKTKELSASQQKEQPSSQKSNSGPRRKVILSQRPPGFTQIESWLLSPEKR